jgi:spore coat polysaccharide biosynthesis predicted glycosyltransferase SpsG
VKKVVALLGSSGYGIGFGHLFRLISLSQVLSQRAIVCFHGSFEPTENFKSICEEYKISTDCLCKGSPNTVVIDTYDPQLLEQNIFNKNAKVVQLVDELSPEIIADAYIKVSPTKEWKPLNISAHVKEFSNDPLLRRQFFQKKLNIDYNKPPTNRVLVLIGGSSESKVVLKLIKSSLNISSRNLCAYLATNDSKLADFAESLDFKIVPYLDNFYELISNYDFVISAAGVTAWELLLLKAKFILISLADNQNYQINYLNRVFGIQGLIYDKKLKKIEPDLSQAINMESGEIKNRRDDSAEDISDGAVKINEWLSALNLV